MLPNPYESYHTMKSENLSWTTIINKLVFLWKTVIIQWNTSKNIFTVAWEQINRKKILDPCNAKNIINHFCEKEKHKISKKIRNNYQLKTFENPNTVDIKSVITEHQKTSYKFSKIIR